MQFFVRTLSAENAEAASQVTKASFEKFVSTDWEPNAVDEFLASISIESFENILRTCAYSIGMFNEKTLIGLLIMPKATIIQMLFIHPDWTRQGIGRGLWSHARAHLVRQGPYRNDLQRDGRYQRSHA
jgi:hypothetical protein